MAPMPIASLAACSWCGLLAERGPICDSCGSPVTDTSTRTTVLRVPDASPHKFRGAVPAPRELPAFSPAPAATPSQPGRRAARWLNVGQAAVMSGVPEPTLRRWVSSRTPEDVPILEGDPRFLLIRTPGLKLPDGMWMVDGPKGGTMTPPAPAHVSTPEVRVQPAPVRPSPAPSSTQPAAVAPVPPVPRPDISVKVDSAPAAPIAPPETVRPEAKPPPPSKPEPPVRAPILSDLYVAALLAEDVLPETWGFDSSPDERKLFRRHKLLTTAGVVLGFAGVAELIDFLMSHLR